jgi:hypothetical protein
MLAEVTSRYQVGRTAELLEGPFGTGGGQLVMQGRRFSDRQSRVLRPERL